MARKNESLAYLEKEMEKIESKNRHNSSLLNEKEQELNKYANEYAKLAKEK